MPLFSGIKNASTPNQLFTALESREWKRVVEIAKRSPALAERALLVKRFYGKSNTIAVNALQMACKNRAPPEVVEAIMEACPALATATDAIYRRNALHVAAIFGAPAETVNALLQKNRKGASAIDKDGRLAIHFACGCLVTKEADKINILRSLLKANPASAMVPESKEGFIPLHVACQSAGSYDVIRILALAAPESVFAKSRTGRKAVDCARDALDRDSKLMDGERIGFLERFEEESSSQGFFLAEHPLSPTPFQKKLSVSDRTERTAQLSSCELSLTESSD